MSLINIYWHCNLINDIILTDTHLHELFLLEDIILLK